MLPGVRSMPIHVGSTVFCTWLLLTRTHGFVKYLRISCMKHSHVHGPWRWSPDEMILMEMHLPSFEYNPLRVKDLLQSEYASSKFSLVSHGHELPVCPQEGSKKARVNVAGHTLIKSTEG